MKKVPKVLKSGCSETMEILKLFITFLAGIDIGMAIVLYVLRDRKGDDNV